MKIHFINLIFKIVSYFIISVTIVIILIKLRELRSSVAVFKFRVGKTNDSKILTSTSTTTLNNSFLVKRQQIKHVTRGPRVPATCSFTFLRRNLGPKFQNSKMLVTLAAFFLLMNIPFLLGILISVFYFETNPERSDNASRVESQRLKAYVFLNISDILRCSTYGLTGFLFFASGRLFRLHFRNRVKEMLCFKCS